MAKKRVNKRKSSAKSLDFIIGYNLESLSAKTSPNAYNNSLEKKTLFTLETREPLGPYLFNFMQFSGKKHLGLAPVCLGNYRSAIALFSFLLIIYMLWTIGRNRVEFFTIIYMELTNVGEI